MNFHAPILKQFVQAKDVNKIKIFYKGLKVKLNLSTLDEEIINAIQFKLKQSGLLYYYETYGYLICELSGDISNCSIITQPQPITLGFNNNHKNTPNTIEISSAYIIPYCEDDIPKTYTELYTIMNIDDMISKLFITFIDPNDKISQEIQRAAHLVFKSKYEIPIRIDKQKK